MPLPDDLLTGYRAFVEGRLPAEQSRYAALADQGQSPEVLIIGCCDSRVSPEVIFDARPGQLFVVRNVANLVPPYDPDGDYHGTSAALEFAVQALRVKHIVVLGHARCGGVRAFAGGAEPLSPGDFIGKWVSLLEPAAATVPQSDRMDVAGFAARLEIASLLRSLAALRTYPCIQSLEGRGRIRLHACYFDIATGLLSSVDETTETVTPVLAPDEAVRVPRFSARAV